MPNLFDKTLASVTEKIVKKVPEIREVYNRCMKCGYGYEFCKHLPNCRNPDYDDRTIRLEDVLKAWGDCGIGRSDFDTKFFWINFGDGLRFDWILNRSLANQTLETLQVLDQVLL